MHTQYRGAFLQRHGVEHGGAVERRRGVAADETVYHALARHAYKHGQLKRKQTLRLTHYLVVLLERLAEAVAGVENDVLRSEVAQALHLSREVLHHLRQRRLHRHQYVGHTELRHGLEHVAFLVYLLAYDARYAAFRHVVDDVGAELLHTSARHKRAVGVYRHDGVGLLAAHYLKGALQTLGFFLKAHLVGAGACGESAHVDDASALGDYLVGAVGYLSLGLLARSAVERVGRCVQYAHHHGLREVEKSASHVYCVLHILLIIS